MPDTEDAIVQWKPDGTVRLKFEKPVTLRRPTVGMVEDLQEALNAAADEASDLISDLRDKMAAIADEHGVDTNTDPRVEAAGVLLGAWATLAAAWPEEVQEERLATLTEWLDEPEAEAHEPVEEPRDYKRAVRDANRDANRAVRALYRDIGRQVFKSAAPNYVLPDDDRDLDTTLGQQGFYTKLARHWQGLPLVSGRG